MLAAIAVAWVWLSDALVGLSVCLSML